jgi:hypothetical protein
MCKSLLVLQLNVLTYFNHLIKSFVKEEFEPVARYLSQWLAMNWKVRGSNPGGGEIFHTHPDRPWGPTSLLYNGYRVFPRVKKRPGRDADPSPLLVPRSKNRVFLYLYSP